MTNTLSTIIAVVFGGLGILIGAALAILITVWLVRKSNDVGDSSGTPYDFRANINLFDDTNDVYDFSEKRSEEIFRNHLKAAMEEAALREEKRKKNPAAGIPKTLTQR